MQRVFEMELAGRKMTVETGWYAQQAGGSCLVRCGDTAVLVCATASAKPREGIDFFPLVVDYEEKLYAVGKIPGGFIKRESRPSEKAILTARLIDRPIRPLFPKGHHPFGGCGHPSRCVRDDRLVYRAEHIRHSLLRADRLGDRGHGGRAVHH